MREQAPRYTETMSAVDPAMNQNGLRGETGTMRVKSGLAEMLKGGVIMDVVNAEQAVIAENAGACAVMALERVPADIRRDGGVARMSAGTRSSAITAAAPASSAIFACSALTTSMMTPPFSISARPAFTRNVASSLIAYRC